MYQRILVPVDGSPTSDAGLDEAIKLAKLTHARLRLLHVVDEMPFVMSAGGYDAMFGDILGVLKDAGKEILQAARSKVERGGVDGDTVLFESLNGGLCERVGLETSGWGADLIVLGTHGRRGVGRAFMGSDAEQILRSATVPVLLVRATTADRPRR